MLELVLFAPCVIHSPTSFELMQLLYGEHFTILRSCLFILYFRFVRGEEPVAAGVTVGYETDEG